METETETISPNDGDLIKPQPQRKKKKKKKMKKKKKTYPKLRLNLKLLEEYPESYFMDVRCRGCCLINTIHSHPQDMVHCRYCKLLLCMPSVTPGSPGTLTSRCTFWRKRNKDSGLHSSCALYYGYSDYISPNNGDLQRKKKMKKKYLKLMLNLKLLEEYPESYFMDVRCRGCCLINTIHSHPQDLVRCRDCKLLLCMPGMTYGRPGTLTSHCTFWRKTNKVYNKYVFDPVLPNHDEEPKDVTGDYGRLY